MCARLAARWKIRGDHRKCTVTIQTVPTMTLLDSGNPGAAAGRVLADFKLLALHDSTHTRPPEPGTVHHGPPAG